MTDIRRCLFVLLVLAADCTGSLAAPAIARGPAPDSPADASDVYPIALGYRDSIYREIELPPVLLNCLCPVEAPRPVENWSFLAQGRPLEAASAHSLYALMSLQR